MLPVPHGSITPIPYTTRLQAGLGLVEETLTLLDLWSPGMSVPDLNRAARDSGRFPNVTARRLLNIVSECFGPRYLVDGGKPAAALKLLTPVLARRDLLQLLLLHTARANPILGDFVRQVYWERYAAGHTQVANQEAIAFVQRAIDLGHMASRWSDSTIRRVAAYLTGCCADYGLLESGARRVRRILPFHLSPVCAAYVAHALHFAGVGDNVLLHHEDWQLYGLGPNDVLEELKRLSLQGHLLVQSAGDLVRIAWKHPDMETFCRVLAQG